MALNDIIERETDTDSMTVDDVRDYLDSYTPKKKSSALKRSLVGLLGGAVLMFGSCVQNGAGGGGGGSVNTPPEISASYDAGTVTVRADDVDGVIAEMYQNGSSILAQDTNPAADVFEAEFDGLAPGDYEFRAVDDAGAAVSDVVTVPQTGPDPYESIDATIDLSASSVQHNMDAAAEVYASVDVTDGGYDTAKWFADGQEIGTSTHGNDFGIDVDWVGVKEITAEFYNSLDEKLDTVSAGNLEGLNTAPDDVVVYFKNPFGGWTDAAGSVMYDEGDIMKLRLKLSDDNNDICETMEYDSGVWDLFGISSSWGPVAPTSNPNVPNHEDVYILRDPEGTGDANLYQVHFNTDGRALGPPYTAGFAAREENTPGELESSWYDLDIFID